VFPVQRITATNGTNPKSSSSSDILILTMKTIYLLLVTLVLLTGTSCSKNSEGETAKNPSLHEGSAKHNGLRIGMDYRNTLPSHMGRAGNFFDFNGTAYVFNRTGVSVYRLVGPEGDIYQRHSDGMLLASGDLWNYPPGKPKGSSVILGTDGETRMDVIFGPGDRMPVLENAPYKVEGDSIYIDWSQGHSRYFALGDVGSGSEVFTIKNEGLVLASATAPGMTLTLSINSEQSASTASKNTAKSPDEEREVMARLAQMDSAKEQWALQFRKYDGDPVSENDIGPYIPGPFPKHPSGGKYIINPIGKHAESTKYGTSGR
jgi:hypothetical protein